MTWPSVCADAKLLRLLDRSIHLSIYQSVWLRNQGFRQLLQYAGYAWAIETELASPEDIKGYWENALPIWQVKHGGRGLPTRARRVPVSRPAAPTNTRCVFLWVWQSLVLLPRTFRSHSVLPCIYHRASPSQFFFSGRQAAARERHGARRLRPRPFGERPRQPAVRRRDSVLSPIHRPAAATSRGLSGIFSTTLREDRTARRGNGVRPAQQHARSAQVRADGNASPGEVLLQVRVNTTVFCFWPNVKRLFHGRVGLDWYARSYASHTVSARLLMGPDRGHQERPSWALLPVCLFVGLSRVRWPRRAWHVCHRSFAAG